MVGDSERQTVNTEVNLPFRVVQEVINKPSAASHLRRQKTSLTVLKPHAGSSNVSWYLAHIAVIGGASVKILNHSGDSHVLHVSLECRFDSCCNMKVLPGGAWIRRREPSQWRDVAGLICHLFLLKQPLIATVSMVLNRLCSSWARQPTAWPSDCENTGDIWPHWWRKEGRSDRKRKGASCWDHEFITIPGDEQEGCLFYPFFHLCCFYLCSHCSSGRSMRDQRTTPLICSFFSQLFRTESEQTSLTAQAGWLNSIKSTLLQKRRTLNCFSL